MTGNSVIMLSPRRCYHCKEPRPEGWALGLEVECGGRPVGWLCPACEAVDGQAWDFVNLITYLCPSPGFYSTVLTTDIAVRARLVLPSICTVRIEPLQDAERQAAHA